MDVSMAGMRSAAPRVGRLLHSPRQSRARGGSLSKVLIALITLVVMTGTLLVASSAQAGPGQPGTRPNGAKAPAAPSIGLNPEITETGKVALSTDGLGTNDPAGGTVQVQKPAGATVRSAYLAAASTGFSGRTLVNGDVSLAGTPVTFSQVIPSGISSSNGFANVTSIVKPVVDGAAAGVVNLQVTEVQTGGIDGVTIAVIFDVPSLTVSNTVALLFGAQQTTGDTFAIGLANPINKSDPNLKLNMALGISFGFQGGSQFSQIDVNTQRLTTAAGGQDDCPITESCGNGALLTMGGIGDSTTNPPDPNAGPADCAAGPPRCDDELYDLLPFVNTGDTTINVATLNPSNDDNIFFGAFTLNSVNAVIGEGITLSPASATNPVGQNHTLTATAQDDNGDPIVNRQVTFSVLSGPRAGLTGTDNTDAQGKATFTYTSTVAGTDTIQASFVNSLGETVTSGTVTKTWVANGNRPTTCVVTAVRAGPPKQQDVTVRDLDGIAAIYNVNVTNGTVNVPSFTAGTTAPVVLTATKTNQAQRTFWEFDVRDSKGVVKHCV